MSLESLIGTYGYLAVGVGTLLEGEFVLLLSAIAARRGYLNLGWVILTATLGTIVGDQILFLLGRHQGTRLLRKHPGWDRKSARARAWMDRHRILLLLSFRFITGIRTVTVLLFGMSSVRAWTFLLLSSLGGIVWGLSYGLGGYFLGMILKPVLDRAKRYEAWAFAAAVLVWAAVLGIRKLRSRRA